VWYKFSKLSSQNPNVQELDPNSYRQMIPSGSEGRLEVELVGGQFFMGPDDPPKQVQIKTSDGTQRSIWLLHGTEDGKLVFGERGNLIAGDANAFKDWLRSNGYPDLPYISCNGSKINRSSGGADQLINSAGAVQVGTVQEDGIQKLVFQDA
jgi:hypothetical protein